VLTKRFFFRKARYPFSGSIEIDYPPVSVYRKDAVRDRIKDKSCIRQFQFCKLRDCGRINALQYKCVAPVLCGKEFYNSLENT